jgi:hypothetical protein
MRIPPPNPKEKDNPNFDREQFLDEIIQICEGSAMKRLQVNSTMRNYCLFGSDGGEVKYNKIWPTIDLLSAFLYGQEGVTFSIKFGAGVPEEQAVYGEKMRAVGTELWHDTGTDEIFGDAVFWALVYGTTILKTVNNGGLRTYMVNPHMIGVYREDTPKIDDQEAITHLYYTTKSGLETSTKIIGAEKQAALMDRVTSIGPVEEHQAPSTVTQIIARGQLTATTGVTGNIQSKITQYDYRSEVGPDLIEMREVWVYDDELEDYRVFTIASPGVVIFDRPGKDLCYKGEHPFTKISPFPLPDYFWAQSMVQNLMGLQDWRDAHSTRVDMVFRRKLRPSRTAIGPGGALTEEKMLALDREGGFFNMSNPAAKFDTYVPDVDINSALAYLHNIDEKFDEMAGVGANLLRGVGDEGVRSMQHAQVLSRMGSARIKRAAMKVEDPAERIATLMSKVNQEHDKNKYLDDDNKEFVLAQATSNYQIKVSGHSLSPVFIEDTKAQAEKLVQMHAMTRKRFLDQTQPPMVEELKRDLKKIEEGEQKQEQTKAAIELVKVSKHLR